ncbi:hypothetical protein SAMN05192575_11319 [Nocardioides alpinus]|uniref:Protein kinase domain-containing protein n=1 Tax=Nocardioides alpinus TaxID=748909 RepID=A0A1I1B7U0_9ACTN|nr:hypothetical protein SAMN05192575_11319 [Nocardioides alpinus]
MKLSQLGVMTPLAKGGAGEVFDLDRSPDSAFPHMVYKAYLPEVLGTDAIKFAEQAVEFRDSLSPADKAELDAFSAWPVDVVKDGRTTVGVIMPRIDREFFHVSPGAGKTIINDFQWLLVDQAKLRSRGTQFDDLSSFGVRLRLLANFVHVLDWLHRRRVIVGDISFRNVAFAMNPPRVKFLDCDGFAFAPASATATGRTTPTFAVPELSGNPPHQRTVDEQTDIYKTGLVVLRCMTPGPGATQRAAKDIRLLAGLVPDQIVAATVGDCLAVDRSQRPTAASLYAVLQSQSASLSSPPTIAAIDVDSTKCLRGTDVIVTWDVTGAVAGTLRGPSGLDITVDFSKFPTGMAVPAQATGPLELIATNKYGSTTVQTPWVRVFELPAVIIDVPRPPKIGPISPLAPLDELQRSLSGVRVETPALVMPALNAANLDLPVWLAPEVQKLRPATALVESFDGVRDEMLAGGRALSERLGQALRPAPPRSRRWRRS